MIQNDIDLLQQQTYKDPYYFCLRLLNLTRNKKKLNKNKKNSHFKFLVEQQNYVIDQTTNKIENIFWIMRTLSMSLNKQSLYFFVPDIKQSSAEFQLKMYLISQEEVEEIAIMPINCLTYIQVYLQFGKTVFKQTASICAEYSLEYQIYVEKTKIELDNLIKNTKDQNPTIKNAFKKKSHEIIEIQNQKVSVKNKQSQAQQSNILRKSLHFNIKKLEQIKKRKQQLKQRSSELSMSKSSFFSKIGNFFSKQNPSQQHKFNLLESPRQESKVNNHNEKSLSQKSYAFSPPVVGPHRFNRPQNKFYYHSLNIQREKQKQRVRKYFGEGQTNSKIEEKQGKLTSYLATAKVVLIILVFTFVIYYLASPAKKGRLKWSKSWDFFQFW